jgi:hypothetical protein
MSRRKFCLILTSGLLAITAGAAQGQTANKMIIPHGDLCVTEGEVATGQNDHLEVDAPKMRAYVNSWTSQAIEAHFTYLGPTKEESPLGSGEIRRQFGLKLRAQNACNLVYVMWRFEPEARIVVSVKRNPDQTMSSECGNHGYQNIKAKHSSAPPAVRKGDSHDLSAEMRGTALKVKVDGKDVWAGDVGPAAADLKGPIGIRSDNVRLEFDLEAGQYEGPHPHFRMACKSGPDVSD